MTSAAPESWIACCHSGGADRNFNGTGTTPAVLAA
jgi:hypothetical protein